MHHFQGSNHIYLLRYIARCDFLWKQPVCVVPAGEPGGDACVCGEPVGTGLGVAGPQGGHGMDLHPGGPFLLNYDVCQIRYILVTVQFHLLWL